jgi:hypothetical protein
MNITIKEATSNAASFAPLSLLVFTILDKKFRKEVTKDK